MMAQNLLASLQKVLRIVSAYSLWSTDSKVWLLLLVPCNLYFSSDCMTDSIEMLHQYCLMLDPGKLTLCKLVSHDLRMAIVVAQHAMHHMSH